MSWTVEQRRRYSNAVHHLNNVMFEMRQCPDTMGEDEIVVYEAAKGLRDRIEAIRRREMKRKPWED